MNKEKNYILLSIYHDTADQKRLQHSSNSSCNWRLRNCHSNYTWLDIAISNSIWELTIIHKYFYYNSAHTYILHMQSICISDSFSLVFCFIVSFVVFLFASNIKVLYFEKMMRIKSFYGRIFLLSPLFPCKGAILVTFSMVSFDIKLYQYMTC